LLASARRGKFACMDHSSTLHVGDRAPEFSLSAANGAEKYSLKQAIANGPAVIEFLRGTW
jgi:peroxiredoxin